MADLLDAAVRDWPLDLTHVLDLAAGSGEVTIALAGRAESLTAIDPFTAAAYERRTGRPCEAITFEQIAAGALRGRRYSLIVCSFALHLVDASRLPTLCWELGGVTDALLILTPHKRPVIDAAWGWSLTHERMHRRVRARLYTSRSPSQAGAKGLSSWK